MKSDLAGQTVLVTGGTMGIGLACAHELLSQGASVFIAGRQTGPLDSALEELRQNGGARVDGAAADVSSTEAVAGLIDRVSAFGALSGVVNAAGIYGPIGPAASADPVAWLEAVRINLFGTFLVTSAACRAMIAAGHGGSVVLLAGGGAATPFPNYTAYACSKVAVVRFAETVALEVARHDIRVNAVAPGFVATRLHQQTLEAGEHLAGDFLAVTKTRLADGAVPATVAAKAIAFLLSDRAKGISGRFLAAPYDDWEQWPEHLDAIQGSELFTLRRIIPRDRGQQWH